MDRRPRLYLSAAVACALAACSANPSPDVGTTADAADAWRAGADARPSLDAPPPTDAAAPLDGSSDAPRTDAALDAGDAPVAADVSRDAAGEPPRPSALTFFPGTVIWQEHFAGAALPAGWSGSHTTYTTGSVSLPDSGNYGSCANMSSTLTTPSLGAATGFNPGRVYSLVFSMRASATPVTVAVTAEFQDSAGRFVSNGGTDWEQNMGTAEETYVQTFAAPAGHGIANVAFHFERLAQGGAGATLAITGARLVEGEPISSVPKTPFVGDRVRVDAVGNFQVFRAGAWADFFPFSVYDGTFGATPLTYPQIASRGFDMSNTNEVGSSPNPCASQAAGMMTVADVVTYLDPRFALCFAQDFSCWPTDPSQYDAHCLCASAGACGHVLPSEGTHNLQAAVTATLADTCSDAVLYWYYDNEENVAERQHEAYALIRAADAAGGVGHRPFFMNQGRVGMVRGHQADVDIFGSYHNDGGDLAERVFDALVARPYTTAVRSVDATITPAQNRALSWGAIAAGAHGLAFYRWPDVGSHAALVASFAPLRAEIDAMGAFIRAPRASWSPEPDSVTMSSVVLSGRDVGGARYLVAVNPTGATVVTHARLLAGATAHTLTAVALGTLVATGPTVTVAADVYSFDLSLAAWAVDVYRVD